MIPNPAYAPEAWQTVTPHIAALGESPFWHPHEQMLYWVDISGKQILRANMDMGTLETWDLPSEPGCIAPAASGGLVMALRHGVFRAQTWGGPLQLLTTLGYDPTHMRANDGKCDALGRFWVGTIDETRTLHNAALFCIDARNSGSTGVAQVRCMINPTDRPATTANGLAWSPDGSTLYWADTPSHAVWAWDHDQSTNRLSGQRVFADFRAKPEGWSAAALDANNGGYRGRPDGAAVDVQGNYWVAMFEGRRVCQFAPDGSLLAEFAVPLQCPTMPCFGGADRKTLYLTSARHHRSAAELAAYPLSGSVLSMRVEVAGMPVNFFQD
ncbi:SMP-30/gluconolactonase/LRE family protein [Rhodoferax sp.]|uniref:SMP-30/gluconolactonase/LRE family protein n=1 Tax=Rhodoferax sp. TaxID=50421 RepID=UPI0025E7C740|nr:SMP-30/gluconolactonase/LRE family protein [Rhodoferax sp.]MCM2340503.1 SMP-30/gluconolactonase/LRE family protein [Rhodoferax sp.]